jgi:hypothetical protein
VGEQEVVHVNPGVVSAEDGQTGGSTHESSSSECCGWTGKT